MTFLLKKRVLEKEIIKEAGYLFLWKNHLSIVFLKIVGESIMLLFSVSINCGLIQSLSSLMVMLQWKELYTWVADSLVNQGYVTLLFTVPNNLLFEPHQWSDGFESAIDYLLNEKILAARIDPERIGVIGHSMGGLGALIAANKNACIKSVVGLAPANIATHAL